jgi:hypothetical protein
MDLRRTSENAYWYTPASFSRLLVTAKTGELLPHRLDDRPQAALGKMRP